MTKTEIVERFKAHIYSQNTAQSHKYKCFLYARAFMRDNVNGKPVSEISANDLEEYMSEMPDRKNYLPRFKEWLLAHGVINEDTFQNEKGAPVDELVKKYIREQEIKDRTKETIIGIRAKLNIFLGFLQEREIWNISEIAKPVMISFMQYLQMKQVPHTGKGYDMSYKSQVLARTKDFFKYLLKEQEITYDPSVVVVVPKRPKRVCRNILNIEEISEMEKKIDTGDAFGFRDLCMIETLYGGGMRATEMCNLRVEDIEPDDRTVLIRNGKDRKDRMVPINRHAAGLLERYISSTRKKIIGQTGSQEPIDRGRLFLNRNGTPMTREILSQDIKKYGVRARLDKKVTPHTLRHSCATHMLNNGADIRYLQRFLGHKNLSATQVYLKVAIADLKETIEKYHPLEVKKYGRHTR